MKLTQEVVNVNSEAVSASGAPMRTDIWHNILWSKYKGVVFSETAKIVHEMGKEIKFYQIAATEGRRTGLSAVDTRYHTYPYELIFEGSYDEVPKLSLFRELARRVWTSKADLII